MRRLRQNGTFRRLVRETTLAVDDLLQPFFVVPGHGVKEEISSLPGNYHLSIDCLVEEAKKAIQEGKIETINAAVERLTTASHKLAEAMYKQHQAAPSAAPAGEGESGGGQAGAAGGDSEEKAKGGGEVIDAEVVEGDDKNKQ